MDERKKEAELKSEIDKLKLANQELCERIEKYRVVIESTDDSVYLVDKTGRYLFMNKRHQARMRLNADAVMGREYGDFHSEEETIVFRNQIGKVLLTGESAQFEHKSKRDGGYFLRTMSPVIDSTNAVYAVTVFSKDITPLKVLEAELYALSLSDELTSLYNRRGFMTLALQQLKISRRMRRKMLLIFVDMDYLKSINDSYGHADGDTALRAMAVILKKTFRESDILARIGGDEFAVLITDFENGCEEDYLNRLSRNIDEFNRKGSRPYLLSISTGVVLSDPSAESTIDDLLISADRRMYEQRAVRRQGSNNGLKGNIATPN
jgi:diguanylate cyclase (GGDEF)-like protein/PAS domain S-box-containing protein